MAEKPPPPRGVQLADLLRRAGLQPTAPSEPKPPPAAPPEPFRPPAEPEREAAAVPEEPEVRISATVQPAEVSAPLEPREEVAEAAEGEDRVVTIQLSLTARQLAEILAQRVPEVMTIEQAAAYLRVSPGYLAQLCRANRAPGFKVGRKWRFKKSVLDQWLMEASGERWQPAHPDESRESVTDAEPFADFRSS